MVTSRILFTAKQKDELWERWKNGQSVLAISRALERRNKTGVQRIVALNGGIAPAPRCRAVAALKLEEREEISRGIAAGRSVRRIARGLKRSPSTISREIRRNGGSQTYRANRAERSAWERALRAKPCRLALHGELRWRVAQKLALQWSPEQISGWLKQQFPTDRDMRISHEADLSQSLCSDARRAEEGADGTVAYKAADASRQRRQGQEWTGAHTRYGLYPRATRRGRGSRRSWPLGRRSSYRSKRHAHRDARRTPQPLYDARQASKEGHDDCGCRAR